MNSEVKTLPGTVVFSEVQGPEGCSYPTVTAQVPFDSVKHLLSERPMRRGVSARMVSEPDQDDIHAAREAAQDPERIPYADARKELGLE